MKYLFIEYTSESHINSFIVIVTEISFIEYIAEYLMKNSTVNLIWI